MEKIECDKCELNGKCWVQKSIKRLDEVLNVFESDIHSGQVREHETKSKKV